MKRKEFLEMKYFKFGLNQTEYSELMKLFNLEEIVLFHFQVDLQAVIRRLKFERLRKTLEELDRGQEKPLGKMVEFNLDYPIAESC